MASVARGQRTDGGGRLWRWCAVESGVRAIDRLPWRRVFLDLLTHVRVRVRSHVRAHAPSVKYGSIGFDTSATGGMEIFPRKTHTRSRTIPSCIGERDCAPDEIYV